MTRRRKAKTTAPEPTLIERLEAALDASIAGIEHPSQVLVHVAVPREDLQAAVRGLKLREVSTGLPEDFLTAWDDLRRGITAVETANLQTVGEAIRWLEEERQKFEAVIREAARNA